VRPIIGWHLRSVDVIVNPIFDTSYDGVKNLEFVPAMRVAYKASSTVEVAVETYLDFGPVRQFYAAGSQAHQIYAVIDKSTRGVRHRSRCRGGRHQRVGQAPVQADSHARSESQTLVP
jgi:hypothetical protein